MKLKSNAGTTARKKKDSSAAAKKAGAKPREYVPIIAPSETSNALTREAAKDLLLLETQKGGKLHGMCLIPDSTLETMQRLLALVGRAEEIEMIGFRNNVDYGVEIRHLRPQKP
ncbi:hypothetical protein ACVWZL_007354 [Bradyrhizobium sp. GM2.4]